MILYCNVHAFLFHTVEEQSEAKSSTQSTYKMENEKTKSKTVDSGAVAILLSYLLLHV